MTGVQTCALPICAEDVFLIDGAALHDDATLLQLEAELIEALLPKSN